MASRSWTSLICLENCDWALAVSSLTPRFFASSLMDCVSAIRNGLASFSDWEKPTVAFLRSSFLPPYASTVQVLPSGAGEATCCAASAEDEEELPFDASSSDFAQEVAVKATAAARETTTGRARRRRRWVVRCMVTPIRATLKGHWGERDVQRPSGCFSLAGTVVRPAAQWFYIVGRRL